MLLQTERTEEHRLEDQEHPNSLQTISLYLGAGLIQQDRQTCMKFSLVVTAEPVFPLNQSCRMDSTDTRYEQKGMGEASANSIAVVAC